MSENKHTNGKWTNLESGDSKKVFARVDRKAGTEHILIADCNNRLLPIDQQKANARLIAAAPELLAALRGAVSTWTMHPTLREPDLAACRAAISKAEGR